MVTIKRIRIKNFRSIVDETIDAKDFNLFVGVNDCGKSNVLKALNLFFNSQTDFNTPFDFEIDYSKFAKKGKKQAKEISIAIDLNIPETFKEHENITWTKKWRTNGLHYDDLKELFNPGSKGQTLLSRIEYLYIPAVKSNEYFKHLLSQVYSSMTKNADSALKDLNKNYSKQLQQLTETLSRQLRENIKIQSELEMPKDLNVLFKDLSFSTSDDFVSSIDLKQRGDGIKARHIPSILRYIQTNAEQNKLKNAIGNSYIWGFEEPENGVEFLSCFEMANELYLYSKNCQIFITSHSPAFYSIKDSDNTVCYYTSKTDVGTSKYNSNLNLNEINDKIGLMPLVSPYIKEERERYLKQIEINKHLLDEINILKEKTNRIYIITEGKTDTKYLKAAFEKLNIDRSVLERLEYYDFDNRNTLGDELTKLLDKLSHIPNNNLYIGIYDRDKPICADISKPYLSLGNNVYKFNIPALKNNERNEEDKICIEHYFSNDEIRIETGRGHLYLGMDFDNFGRSKDELWVYKDYEKNNNINKISIIDKNCKNLQRLNANSQASIISKDDFADYVISHDSEFCFNNFLQIFNIIKQISEIRE